MISQIEPISDFIIIFLWIIVITKEFIHIFFVENITFFVLPILLNVNTKLTKITYSLRRLFLSVFLKKIAIFYINMMICTSNFKFEFVSEKHSDIFRIRFFICVLFFRLLFLMHTSQERIA